MIPVGISNRHIHLNEADKNLLFGNEYKLEVRRNLKQVGQFSSESVVSLKTDKGIIENVRVIGPIRNYTQVELLKSDELILGIHIPFRNSGDLANSASLTIVGPLGKIYKENCAIIANRHVHIPPSEKYKYGVEKGDIVKIKKDDVLINNVYVKSDETCVLECHLDKDDESNYNIHTGDMIDIVKE